MLTSKPGVAEALDLAQIGFLTAVNPKGQPQTTPVWFLRDGDDLIVYNQPTSPRLTSIAGNDRVAFTLRADRKAIGLLTIEGTAAVDTALVPADQSAGYLAKYDKQIERLGWAPAEFAAGYSVGIRIKVNRMRVWDIDRVIAAERRAPRPG